MVDITLNLTPYRRCSAVSDLRMHALGDPAAIAHLREIDDEIAVLSK
jgi:hypothetical protein